MHYPALNNDEDLQSHILKQCSELGYAALWVGLRQTGLGLGWVTHWVNPGTIPKNSIQGNCKQLQLKAIHGSLYGSQVCCN